MTALAIEARHLVKAYKNKAAVRDLSLSVRPGVLTRFWARMARARAPRCGC